MNPWRAVASLFPSCFQSAGNAGNDGAVALAYDGADEHAICSIIIAVAARNRKAEGEVHSMMQQNIAGGKKRETELCSEVLDDAENPEHELVSSGAEEEEQEKNKTKCEQHKQRPTRSRGRTENEVVEREEQSLAPSAVSSFCFPSESELPE